MKKFALFGAMCVGLFGCSNKPANTQEPSTDTAQTATAPSNLPANAPVVRVATSGVLPPLNFLNEQGNLQGIDVDVIRAIGENQGFKVEVYQEKFIDILPALEAGKYQAVISGLSVSPERIAKFDHSNFYLYNPSVIMHKPDVKIVGLSSLKPLRVATMENTTQAKLVDGIAPTSHEKVDTVFQLYQGLVQGKYDAVLQDKYFLEYVANNYPEQKVTVTEYDKNPNSAGIVIYVKKGDQELLNQLNTGINHLQQSGEIEKIIAKYLNTPPTSQ